LRARHGYARAREEERAREGQQTERHESPRSPENAPRVGIFHTRTFNTHQKNLFWFGKGGGPVEMDVRALKDNRAGNGARMMEEAT